MKKVILLLLTIMLAIPAFAGEDKRGTAGFMFLKVPIGAREVGMGNAGMVLNGGASAMYWNPANMANSEGVTFSGSYLNYFAGIQSQYGAMTFPLEDIGTLGFSIHYFDYGNVERTTETQLNGLGTFSPFEMALSVGFSRQITDRVSGGLNVKFIRSDIAEVAASGMAFDFGFTYKTGYRGLTLAFVIQNIGPQSEYEGEGLLENNSGTTINTGVNNNETAFLRFGSEPFDMPASVSLGAAFELYKDEQNSIMGVLDQNINSFQGSRTNLGAEYGYNDMFFARIGYNTTWERDLDLRTGEAQWAYLSAGAGIKYDFGERYKATLDYGYMNVGALGGTHRFTVGVNF